MTWLQSIDQASDVVFTRAMLVTTSACTVCHMSYLWGLFVSCRRKAEDVIVLLRPQRRRAAQRLLPTWGGFKKMLVKGDDFSEPGLSDTLDPPLFSGPAPSRGAEPAERAVIGGYGPQFVQYSPSSQGGDSASSPFVAQQVMVPGGN